MNILVTGGASGFGEAITKELAKDKSNFVYFTFCKSESSKSIIEKQFPNTFGIHCDFENESSVNTLLTMFEKFKIEVLVNNAMTGLQTTHFHKADPHYFKTSFEKNILPVIKITQAAILHFRKKKEGKIITVLSSYLKDTPPIGLSEYVASKNYLLSLSNSWAAENQKFNISSNCISPAFMLTGLTSATDDRILEEMRNNRPDGKLLSTKEAAQGIFYFCKQPTTITAQNLFINTVNDIP